MLTSRISLTCLSTRALYFSLVCSGPDDMYPVSPNIPKSLTARYARLVAPYRSLLQPDVTLELPIISFSATCPPIATSMSARICCFVIEGLSSGTM